MKEFPKSAGLLLRRDVAALMILAVGSSLAGPFLYALQVSPGAEPGLKQRTPSPMSLPCREAQSASPQKTAADYTALGRAFVQQKRFDCATAAFEAALALDPKSWQSRYAFALARMQEKDFARAAENLKIAAEQEPERAELRGALGVCLRELGRLDDAAEEFKSALAIDPALASTALNLAGVLDEQKRYTAEAYYLEKGLSNPGSADRVNDLQLALAAAYAHAENYGAAIPLFQKLLASSPLSARLHFELANTYAQNQQFQEAAAEYKEAVRLDLANTVALLSLGKSFVMLKQYQAALPYLRDYTLREPNQPDGFALLGQTQKDVGRLPDAEQSLKRALTLDPGSYQAAYNLGVVLERSGRRDEAVQEFRRAEQLNPQAAEVAYELGLALGKDNQPDASRQELQRFQELRSKQQQAAASGDLIRKGNRLALGGASAQAIPAYREALKLDPRNALAHYDLSLALAASGDLRGEWEELTEALRLDPNLAKGHNRLGLRYSGLGKIDDAESEFKTAIAIDPRYAEAENNLAVLYGREGKNADAVALLRRAVSDDTEYAQAFVNLGVLLAGDGRYGEAEKSLDRALKLDPRNDSALKALSALKAVAIDPAKHTSGTPIREP